MVPPFQYQYLFSRGLSAKERALDSIYSGKEAVNISDASDQSLFLFLLISPSPFLLNFICSCALVPIPSGLHILPPKLVPHPALTPQSYILRTFKELFFFITQTCNIV
jgi:hypothetical protein